MSLEQKLTVIESLAESVKFQPASPSEHALSEAVSGLAQVVREIMKATIVEGER